MARRLLGGILLLSGATGCKEPQLADEDEEAWVVVGEGPFDPSDGRTVVELELVLGPEADLRALSAQELRYEGPKTDPRGERFVVVRTTVPHALELVRYDLHARPRRLWARRGREASGATEVAADAWAPGRPMGALTGGYLLREHNGWSESWKAARPALLVSLWRPDDTGELLADALGSVQPFERLREGVRFDGWVLRQWPGSDRKPMCVPCEVEVFNKRAQGAVRLGPGKCGDCLELCDPSRLPHAGFELVREPASGPPTDCYWVPREEGAWLEVPLSPDPWGPEGTSRYCTLQFSTYWHKRQDRPDWRLVRYEPDGSERVLRTVPAEPPLFPIPPEADRLRNHVFEANASLPDSTQGFRIEVTSIPSGAAEPMRIYEPVVSCWRQ